MKVMACIEHMHGVYRIGAIRTCGLLSAVSESFGGRNPDQNRLLFDDLIKQSLRVV